MGIQQLHTQKLSVKQRIYTIASTTWTITSWIWTTIIIVFVLQLIIIYISSDPKGMWENMVALVNNDHSCIKDACYTWVGDSFWQVLRNLAIIASSLFISITILAWVLKHNLCEGAEGLDKIIEALEHDTFTPHLEILQIQFRQLLQGQAVSVKVLSQIDDQLRQMPTVTDLKDLQASAYRQESTWKKAIDQALQDIHTQAQDIHTRTIEQAGWLGDLVWQNQHTEKTISADLHAIASILEQLRDKVEVTPLPQQMVSKATSDQFAMAEPSKVTIPLPLRSA